MKVGAEEANRMQDNNSANSIDVVRAHALEAIKQAQTRQDIENVRVRFLGKKGEITALLRSLGSLPKEERPEAGKRINDLRDELTQMIKSHDDQLRKNELDARLQSEKIDVTMPGKKAAPG